MLITAERVISLYNAELMMLHGAMHLLACPFCGGEARIKTSTFGDNDIICYGVECENGHALDYWNEDKSKAIDYWNSRK